MNACSVVVSFPILHKHLRNIYTLCKTLSWVYDPHHKTCIMGFWRILAYSLKYEFHRNAQTHLICKWLFSYKVFWYNIHCSRKKLNIVSKLNGDLAHVLLLFIQSSPTSAKHYKLHSTTMLSYYWLVHTMLLKHLSVLCQVLVLKQQPRSIGLCPKALWLGQVLRNCRKESQ